MIDPIDNLPTIRESLSKLNLSAKKSLGQNFLLDPAFTDKIAESAAPFEGTVIEIGPGPGGLTRSILLMGAHELIAIEKDRRAIIFLEELKKAAAPRLQIKQADALKNQFGNMVFNQGR